MTGMAPGTENEPDPDEIVNGQMTAVQLVLSYLNQDGLPYQITSPAVVDALCLLVVQGLVQLGAAESLLTEDQAAELHSGAVSLPDPQGFARAALEGLLGRLILQEAMPGA